MKIGILQTGHAPNELLASIGDYDDMFRKFLDGHDFHFITFDIENMGFPSGPAEADAWLITGSRHGAYEDLPFIAPLEALIHAIVASNRPLIGVCFGHQIIAKAMGGKVEKFHGGWSIGNNEYTYQGKTISLNAWHQDQVTKVPEGAKIIGSSQFCKVAALTYKDHIFSIQPHPEFDSTMIDALIQYRGSGIVPTEMLEEAKNKLSLTTNNADIAADMAAFLKRKA
ncbi:MAG: type 1 glutamine amidotransferase [Tateyamaria sp.]|jgi:GMP synthase-like glutamine amidotransferase|nr:type 1 glutamine amidotransferase [Tateyamaria sp.]MBT7448880.1 type 1 glutamine amidotransferase [Tateyamaria sp.]